MKGSIELRESQKPLFRAKFPLSFLGFPFQSGVVAGEVEDLSFNLTAFFKSGRSLKVAYRPNDSFNPISVVFKGHFGLPICSLFNMSAEFKGCRNPSFLLHFKPHLGDFTVKEVIKRQITGDAPMEGGVLSDLEMTTNTAVPLTKNAKLSFRWGVRVPKTQDSSMVQMKMIDYMAGISLQKLPRLIINKIGIDYRVRPAQQLGMIKAENLGMIKAENVEMIKAENVEMIKAENEEVKEAIEESMIKAQNENVFKEDIDNLKGEISEGWDICRRPFASHRMHRRRQRRRRHRR